MTAGVWGKTALIGVGMLNGASRALISGFDVVVTIKLVDVDKLLVSVAVT